MRTTIGHERLRVERRLGHGSARRLACSGLALLAISTGFGLAVQTQAPSAGTSPTVHTTESLEHSGTGRSELINRTPVARPMARANSRATASS